MRDIATFSETIVRKFEDESHNVEENMRNFNSLLINTANRVYDEYSKEDANSIIRTQLNSILGYTEGMTPMKRRQAWRKNAVDLYSIIEDVIADKMVLGWPDDPFFDRYCEIRNLALGDKNEFMVEDTSLLQVSEFAGNHHDIVRQKVGIGKSFMVETSRYTIKVYTDYELFRTGKVDFAKFIDRMYASIDKYRKDAIYAAFMNADKVLPTDLKVEGTLTEQTTDVIIDLAEQVRSLTGRDVAFVGTKVALQKLAKTVNYGLWSEEMKNERNKTGMIGNWEGYELVALPRVNDLTTHKDIMDNTKIMIVPVDPEFKPIKIVNEGDVMYFESGMDGMKKDMTVDAEIAYIEGIATVINQVYGVFTISE